MNLETRLSQLERHLEAGSAGKPVVLVFDRDDDDPDGRSPSTAAERAKWFEEHTPPGVDVVRVVVVYDDVPQPRRGPTGLPLQGEG